MIYLLEDDDSIRKLVVYALQSQSIQAAGFEAPEPFWAAMARERPDLLLLDIMLPGEDGITILKRLRAQPETRDIPVIMLTAKNAEYDRVQGLDAGADDYISKPFGMMELVARVRAVLRRSGPKTGLQEYRVGELYLCVERHEVRASGEIVSLTYKEFLLLELLMRSPGVVLTRQVLMDKVWDLGTEPENRTLDVHIRTLRAKLGAAGTQIETVRGVGYRLKGEAK